MKHHNGTYLWVRISAVRFKRESKKPIFHVVFSDISKEVEVQKKLTDSLVQFRYHTERDALTGIYNKDTFYRLVSDKLKNTSIKYEIILVNIEKFKVINDLFGPKIGDEVLKNVADTLISISNEFKISGRIESDHFAICVPVREIDASDLLKLVKDSIKSLNLDYEIIVNAGIYHIEDIEIPISSMCDRAKMALETIGGNYHKHYAIYDDSLRDNLLIEQEIIADMEEALEKRQFFAVYQPIFHAVTNRTVLAEALVRWKHPTKGLIYPNVFIPIFEKNGFITQLDLYMFEEVCRMIHNSQKEGKVVVPISVNVSRMNLYKPNLLEELMDILNKYDVDPSMIKLEITETAYMENPKQLINAVKIFHENGFKVLMDDFGAGYSSLNLLKDVPVDVLKIDTDFIRNFDTSERAGNILISVVRMAKWLNMDVVAEGVETKNQYEFLKEIGGDCIQGYYISRPLEKNVFLNRLSSETCTVENKNNRKKILIVDDIEINRKSLEMIFMDYYDIVEAENGYQAYEILKENAIAFDMVITDIMMPVMDGFELIEKMKKHPLMAQIPIIALTVFDEPDNELRALESGAIDVIVRPYDPRVIRQRVKNILKISEVDKIQSQIHSLKEKEEYKEQKYTIINHSKASIFKILVDKSEDTELLKLCYANETFYRYRGIKLEDRKNPIEYLLNIGLLEGEYDKIYNEIKSAIIEGKRKIQSVFFMHNIAEKSNVHLLETTINYYDNIISLDFIEINIEKQWTKEIMQDEDKLPSCISNALKNANVSLWQYKVKGDKFECIINASSMKAECKKFENIRNRILTSKNFHPDDRNKILEMHDKIKNGDKTVEGIIRSKNYNKKSEEGEYMRHEAFACLEFDMTDNKCIIQDYDGREADSILEIKDYDRLITLISEELVYKRDKEAYLKGIERKELLEKFSQGKYEVRSEYRSLLTGDGRYKWIQSVVRLMSEKQNGHIYAKCYLYDINEEIENNMRIKELAQHDALTNLYNRVFFEKKVKEVLREKETLCAFLMIDLDGFKQVNDLMGHNMGDTVLIDVANCIRKNFRDRDVVGRLGGDEFVAFLTDIVSEEAIIPHINELIKRLTMEVTDGTNTTSVSASIGISFTPNDGVLFSELYQKADTALYHSKQNGKRRYSLYSEDLE